MSEYTIEFAKSCDIDSCKAFDFDYISASDLRRDTETKQIILAKMQGIVIGYLRLNYLWYTTPFIDLIIVEKEHRKKGIGKALLELIITELKNDGKKMILTSTQSTNQEARRWNESAGFLEIGSLKTLHEGGSEELFYRKDF
ncbi:MAG: hypothetical protein A2381_03785 [Bdellovibrionales bacterium RIFOXYB1_FULL_37_110]|nr:MAG: hypothetical protein A2417_16380 [Bdellovibrionales bacterium RIFOXYC1_FULL_37_79]OFZ59157.1 MAG: hypothetical protein A2381_03785 [Bdellovibrionales bacterium RIFOXYB1_FULL_37_110]OFZ64162.1 MAG: hypothetical protein A2577_14815 [Bdellovibrionales bacterium RIFOXYD1_FULL_36_51]